MSVIFMKMTSLQAAPRSKLQRMVSVWKQRAILCTRCILSGIYPTGDMCIFCHPQLAKASVGEVVHHSGICRITIARNPVINHERGKESRILTTPNRTYRWPHAKHIFRIC